MKLKAKASIAVVSVVLCASTCAFTSAESPVTPTSAGSKITNVVYFGNPTADVASLGEYVVCGTGTSADGKPFIDIVVLFAANINLATGGTPPNDAVLDILDSNLGAPSGTGPRSIAWLAPAIQALHKDGLKVLLGILPNHKGTGWSCPGMTAASQQSLATDIANAVAQYDFDGISIDDEYSECPQGQQGPGGDAAVSYGIVYSLRKEQKMTGKLITKSTLWDSFAFGKTSKYNIAPLLDAVWTEVYPSSATDLSAPLSGAMTNPQLGLSADPTSDPKSVAQSVVKGGFGYMMLWGTDGNNKIQDRVNTYTQTLLGETNNPNANVQYGSCR